MYSIQKASLLKRISAAILDFIVITIVVTGVMALISWVTDYDSKYNRIGELSTKYEEEYNVKFNLTDEELQALDEEQKQKIKEAAEAYQNDPEVIYVFNLVINLTLVISTIGLLFGIIINDFIIPLILKNGQTIGKKCFNLCLVKNNCVRVSTFALFVRSFLGKFTIETMIPVYIFILIIFGNFGVIGLIIVLILVSIQLILLLVTENKTVLHDLMAYTVVVDKSSQMIFIDEDDLIKHKQENAKDKTNKESY